MRRVFLFAIVIIAFGAPVASADNCSSPADCEATADYNVGIAVGGGIIAIISVLIGGPTSWDPTSWFRPDPRKGDGTVPPVVPPHRPFVDPYTGTDLTVQDGTRPGGGNIGDVYIREKWRPPAEALEIINERQREMDRENKYNEDKAREGREMVEKGTKDRANELEREAQKERDDRLKELEDERKRKLREKLAEQHEQNVKAQDDANSWGGWTRNVNEEFWDKTTKEIDDLPKDLQDLGTTLVRAGGKGVKTVLDGLKDPENWKTAGDAVISTLTDPFKLATGDPDAWDRFVNGVDTMGRVGKGVINTATAIGQKALDDPIGFIKELTPIKTFEEAMDPNRSLIDRIGRTWLGTIDTILTLSGGKIAKEALEQGGKGLVKEGLEEGIGKGIKRGIKGPLDDTADAAKDALKGNKLPPGVDPKKLDEMNDAWKNRLNQSDDKIKNFNDTRRDYDNAVAKGDPAEIAKARQARHDAALDVQKDKIAIQRLNESQDAAAINGFKNNIRKVYDDTDKGMIKWAEDNGHIGKGAKRIDDGQTGRQVYVDKDGNKLIIAEPTNPPKPGAPPKAGADRDFTMYTQKGKGPPVDIPSSKVRDAYNDNLYKSATGKDPPARIPGDTKPTAADDFAKKMDQAVTDKGHPEAYGAGQRDLDIATAKGNQVDKTTGDVIPGTKDADGSLLKGKGFSDSAQVGDAVTYKADHWFDTKHIDSDEAFFEGSRQLTKQFENQAKGRFDAITKNVEAWKAEGKLADNISPPKPPSPRLNEAMDVMKRVEKMEISPAQAKAELQAMGMTPQDVSRQVGDYVDSLQRVAPPALRGQMGGI